MRTSSIFPFHQPSAAFTWPPPIFSSAWRPAENAFDDDDASRPSTYSRAAVPSCVSATSTHRPPISGSQFVRATSAYAPLLLPAIPSNALVQSWKRTANPGQFVPVNSPSDTAVGTPEVAFASCQITAVTVNGAPVTTAPPVCATATTSFVPSNRNAPPAPRPAVQAFVPIPVSSPGQFVEIRFDAALPAPSSNVHRATSPRFVPPSDNGSKACRSSQPSASPSLSVSGTSGSVPRTDSSPSFNPSSSVSATCGSVPPAYSCALFRSSPSGSAAASSAVAFVPCASSQASGKPSPSVSGSFGSVPCVTASW